MSRPTTNKQLRDEIAWLRSKLATATGFTIPLTDHSSGVFADSLIRRGDRFAIVRHRPMGAQAYIGDQWIPIHQVPDDAFAYDAVDAHRLADVLIAEEVAEAEAWSTVFETREHSSNEEHLAEFAAEVAS